MFVAGDWDQESDENVTASVTLTDDFLQAGAAGSFTKLIRLHVR